MPLPYSRVDGIDLYWEAGGSASGPSILFLHGLGSSSADWRAQWRAFEAEYRLIAVDLRGHGLSGRGGSHATIERLADDVATLLADLGESRVHAVGLSLGGCVALALALRAPARLRSLSVINAFARPKPEGPRAFGRILVRLALLGTAPMSVVAAYVARSLFPRSDQRHLYEAAVASLGRTSRGAYFAALRALARFNVEAELGAVCCPTLVVAGERDPTVPRSAAERLARGIPGAQLVFVADSGHATPLDQPDVFNKAVRDFIAAH